MTNDILFDLVLHVGFIHVLFGAVWIFALRAVVVHVATVCAVLEQLIFFLGGDWTNDGQGRARPVTR